MIMTVWPEGQRGSVKVMIRTTQLGAQVCMAPVVMATYALRIFAQPIRCIARRR